MSKGIGEIRRKFTGEMTPRTLLAGSREQIKRPFLAWHRFAQQFRDGLEVLLVLFIGVMSIVIAFQTNRVAEATKDVTERQSELMEQQLQLQTVNTLPNFVIEEYFSSETADREASFIVITNTGGWARYAEVRLATYVHFDQTMSESSWQQATIAPIDRYFELTEVERGTNGEPFRWRLSTSRTEESFEDFLVDLNAHLSEEYGIEDIRIWTHHQLVISFVDFQGVTHTENYEFSHRPNVDVGDLNRYLRPIAPGDSKFIPQEDMFLTRPTPSYIGLVYPRGSDKWIERLESVGKAIYEGYEK